MIYHFKWNRIRPYSKILMRSNQLAGLGSVIIPMRTTVGAKPHKSKRRVFWNKKSMSKRRRALEGSAARLFIPPCDCRRFGTGMLYLFVSNSCVLYWLLWIEMKVACVRKHVVCMDKKFDHSWSTGQPFPSHWCRQTIRASTPPHHRQREVTKASRTGAIF
jgi:hypothetical protein